ncbi:Uncharacterised protein [Mycobacteroides abscessus subsp. abscessus]|nr:Uncharacterised protein [Mycobacteroides abscessus subsp. abscessus]
MEGRHPQPGDEQHGPDQPVAGYQSGEAGAYSGRGQARRRHPQQSPAIGDETEQRLGQRASQRRGERQTRCCRIAVVTLQHEERDGRGHQALVEVVNSMRDYPVPHAIPRRHGCRRDPPVMPHGQLFIVRQIGHEGRDYGFAEP